MHSFRLRLRDTRKMIFFYCFGFTGLPTELIQIVPRQVNSAAYKRSAPDPPKRSSHHQHGAVLQRLRQMRRLNLFAVRQIGDRARQLEHAVVSPRR